ncbi:MAG: CDP-glycerol glycerophosphotransferase family protein [Flavobacteriaceae bacterium]|nr:CDP-glycerol glycerophosphotransferase family protein [Flavobacteriaceae bacterium]
MRHILFCKNPYAFDVLNPIKEVLKAQNEDFLWYVYPKIADKFPFQGEPFTSKMEDLKAYRGDAIFVPGNEVPHYLRGVKVQVFHGLAGEKKSHFKIRHYFDLYLTQGSYFTNRFLKLKEKYKDFEVIETGWSKFDIYWSNPKKYQPVKEALLKKYQAEKILLYAPTFSPSLTSAPFLKEEIKRLAENKNYLILIKFHDLMGKELIEDYIKLAESIDNVRFESERNITKYLMMADLLISDTSSVIYEFLLLDKPVLTFKNISAQILWDNRLTYDRLAESVAENLQKDAFKPQRKIISDTYHPYKDGHSAQRMVDAVRFYIKEFGVPERRKLSLFRKFKIYKEFGF